MRKEPSTKVEFERAILESNKEAERMALIKDIGAYRYFKWKASVLREQAREKGFQL